MLEKPIKVTPRKFKAQFLYENGLRVQLINCPLYLHSFIQLNNCPVQGSQLLFLLIMLQNGFERRCDLYELFHQLNHWNHFGSGYKGSTIGLLKRLLAE